MKSFNALLIFLCLGAAVGCDLGDLGDPSSNVRIVPLQPIAEVPGANLPASVRPHNWTDARGSGSCVIASTVYNLLNTGQPEAAEHWRRTYAGGQTATGIRRKHDAEGLPYFFTQTADRSFLEWCTATRRSALVWYYPNHCVNFVGLHRDPSRPTDPTVYAWLCDNNRPARFIRVPVDEFQKRWLGYGAFGLSLAAPPVPPPLFDALDRS